MSNLKLDIVLNALGNARQQFDDIAMSGSAASRKIKELRNSVKDLNASQKTFDAFVDSRKKLHGLGSELGRVSNDIRQLKAEISAAGVPTKSQAEKLQTLTMRAKALGQEQKQLRTSSESMRRSLTASGIDTKNLSNGQGQLKSRLEQTNTALNAQKRHLDKLNQATKQYQQAQAKSSSLKSAAGSAAIGGAVTMAAMSVPVRAYAETEDASTQLRMAMMDASGKVPPEYQKLDQLAVSLGDKLPGTTADFKNLMTMLMRQGLSAQSVLGGTGESAALLAVQLKKTPEEAAEMAAKLQDAMRASETEMLSLMDTVQRLFYSGVDSENIIPAFGKLAPALDIMKIKGVDAMKQLGPLIGMLDQAGLSGESAGNALRKVFQSVMDTGKVNKATKGTGISLNFTDGKGEFAGMEHAYKELAKLQKLTTEQRLQVIKDIWGDDAETIQALNTMIEKGQAGYDEFAAKMANQASLNQRVNEQLGTLTNLWDAATGTFTNLMASAGESIAPELKSVTQSIADINVKLSTWTAANPKLAAGIMKTIAAVGIGLVVFAALATAIAAILGPFALLRLSLVQLGPLFVTAMGLVKSALLLTLGLLKTVVVATLGILKMAWVTTMSVMKTVFLATMGILKTVLITTMSAMKTVFLATMGVLKTVLITTMTVMKTVFLATMGALKTGLIMLVRFFMANPIVLAITLIVGALYLLWRNWEAVKNAIISGWQWLDQTFANNPILNALFPLIGAMRLVINNWSVLVSWLQMGWERIKAFFNSGIMNIMSTLLRFTPLGVFTTAMNAVIGYLASLPSRMVQLGANLIGGLINGVSSRIGQLRALVSSALSLSNSTPSAPAMPRSIKGFSSGGYTGSGGKYEVAGIVHKGEGVLNQREIAAIGGPSGFNRLRQMIQTMGGGAMRGLDVMEGGRSQPKPNFREAISVGAAMSMAGGSNMQATGMGNVNITININGGDQSPQNIAGEIKRQLQDLFAGIERKAKTSFRDRD